MKKLMLHAYRNNQAQTWYKIAVIRGAAASLTASKICSLASPGFCVL
jgi:hypothetical protein